MSVRVGTRLDQLLALRNRLDHEIASERRKAALADRRWQTRPPCSADTVRARLDELGITSLEVKVWAVEQGLLLKVVRGRVRLELVEKYAAAHPRP